MKSSGSVTATGAFPSRPDPIRSDRQNYHRGTAAGALRADDISMSLRTAAARLNYLSVPLF